MNPRTGTFAVDPCAEPGGHEPGQISPGIPLRSARQANASAIAEALESASPASGKDLDVLFEISDHPTVLLDRRGVQLAANVAYLKLVGLPRERVLGVDARTLHGPSLFARLLEPALRRCLDGEPCEYEKRVPLRDGSRRAMMIRLIPFRGDNGQVSGAVVCVRDLTPLRQLERELSAARQQFADFADSASDWVWETDADHRFSFMSPGFARATGVPAESMIGRPRELVFDRMGCEDGSIDAHLRDCKEQRPFDGFDFPWIGPGGERRWLRTSGKPVYDEAGVFQGYRGVARDVTEDRRALRALTESEVRFRNLVEGSIQGIVVHRNFRPLFANQAYAEMLGYQHSDDITDLGSLLTLISPLEHRRMQACHRARLEGKAIGAEYELELRRRDGSLFTAHTLAKTITWKGEAAVQLSVVNIDRRKRAERALRDAHQKLSFHLDNSPLAVLEWDAHQHLRRWSRQAERLFGWEAEEVVGKDRLEWPFVVADDRAILEKAMQELSDGGSPRNVIRVRTHSQDGRALTCEWHNSGLRDEAGNLLSIQSLVQNITESQKLAEQLSYEVTHDALTGLLNRRAFEGRLDELRGSAAGHGDEHALCYLDLDQFKIVNDTCGHLAGDELLRKLGSSLGKKTRTGDTLARLGGDEFGLLLEKCSLEDAQALAEDLRSEIDGFRFAWDGHLFRVGASIGVSAINQHSGSAADVMRHADAACYQAKDAGRNRVCVFRADDAETMRRRNEIYWVSAVNSALDEDRLQLYAQPIVPLRPQPHGGHRFEILLRLADCNGKIITPNRFLPAVERYGLASRVDRWVVRSAFQQIAAGLTGDCKAVFAINLSGQTLSDETFHDFVHTQMRTSGVDPSSLCFEITETAAVSDLGVAVRFIDRLREIGCQFALDDFGSGLSSFAYLKQLPVESLKIDGSLVRDIAHDETEKAIVQAIHDMSRALGKMTIAECVENDATLAILREIGVDFAQGHQSGVPTALPDILASIN